MTEAKVLVVDDSGAMRALFSDLLEQTRNVMVVGTAANVAEARNKIEQLRPNVLTLDVEMPGMNGIEFLAEIMSTNPLPVVMLSSLTQAGTEMSLKAYSLGAVECFPKPLRATPEQFALTVGKLGKIVLAAATSNVRGRRRAPIAAVSKQHDYAWNGTIVALSASMGGIEALTQIFASFPSDCPATVVVLPGEPSLIETFINNLARDLPCQVVPARDGAKLAAGTIHIAFAADKHVVIERGPPARLRLVMRDLVDGARPSATLLFGTVARAGIPAVGAVLTGYGVDGAKGLRLMRDAGCRTFVEDPLTALVSEAPLAAIAATAQGRIAPLAELASALVGCCNERQTKEKF